MASKPKRGASAGPAPRAAAGGVSGKRKREKAIAADSGDDEVAAESGPAAKYQRVDEGGSVSKRKPSAARSSAAAGKPAAAENSDDDVAASSSSSSSSGAGAAAAAVAGAGTGAAQWSPTVVVKVGDGGAWSPFKHDTTMGMDRTDLLTALSESKLFGGYFEGVKALSACTVLVLKGALPAGQKLPSAADEAPDKVVALEGSMTLATAVKEGACKGEELFIRVHLPSPSAPAAPAPAAATVLVELPAKDFFAKLAKAILAVEFDADDDVALKTVSSIVLPNGEDGRPVHWPDLKSNALYVRHFYDDLYVAVLGRAIATDDSAGAAIVGMPGIAKSAFGLYVLFRAVREGRTVIYSSRKTGNAVFRDGKAYSIAGAIGDIAAMNDNTTVYISDSLKPAGSKGAFTLVITSPKKANWSEFSKSPGVEVYTMPVFEELELEALRVLAFAATPKCSAEEMKARIAKWGCNPRNVLTKATSASWQKELETAADNLGLAALQEALSKATALHGASSGELVHRLVNLVPEGKVDSSLTTADPEFYTFHHAELVTSYVEDKFISVLDTKDADTVYSFLHKCATDPAAGSLRGKLYERFVVIPRARDKPRASAERHPDDLNLERLDTWASTPGLPLLSGAKLDLPAPMKVVKFKTADQLNTKSGNGTKDGMYIPTSGSFPGIDLVWIIGKQPLLVNSTVSASHDIKAGHSLFLDVVDALGLDSKAATGSEIPFVWALPQVVFDRFDTPGPVQSAKDSVLVTGPSSKGKLPIARRLAQYKLLVPVPPGKS